MLTRSFVNQLLLLVNNGNGTFSGPTSAYLDSTPGNYVFFLSDLSAGDFNGDGRLDIAGSTYNLAYAVVQLNQGNNVFGPPVRYELSNFSYDLTIGDFNGDNRPDLASVGFYTGTGTLSVLLSKGDGSLAPAVDYKLIDYPTAVAVGDMNGDGKVDIVTTSQAGGSVSVFINTGTGSFTGPVRSVVSGSLNKVAVGDFDLDGKLDVATALYNQAVVLLGKGNGELGSPTTYSVGRLTTFLAVVDFNDDNKPDITTVDNDDNTVSILYNCSAVANTPPQPVTTPNLTATVGVPFSYTVNAFTDAQTPNSLTYSATISPANGLRFEPTTRLISGTPTTSGVSSVSIIATDPGGLSASTTFTITVRDGPTSGLIVAGVTTVNCQTVTATERRLSFTPQYSGQTGEPISFSVVNELRPTTLPGPYTLRVYTDNPTLILTAQQGSQQARFAYNWLANCTNNGSTSGLSITGVTTVSCQTVTATERRLSFMPQYSGQTQEPISFSVVNELQPTTLPGPYSLRLYTDNPVVTLVAQQGSQQARFTYNWLTSCSSSGGRWGIEPQEALQVSVLGNPLIDEMVRLQISGASRQPVRVQVLATGGQRVVERLIESPADVELVSFFLVQPSGLYLLQVSTSSQHQVIKLIKR